jgi:Ala-tRNA(Pro) deacylase
MDCKERLEGYFREHGVSFEFQQHRPAYTAQRVAASEHVPGRMFAKVVMADAGGELVMLVLPASAVVDVEKAATVVSGGPVRMASEQAFASRFPDCEPGAMPPFGNLYGVPVYVDRALGTNERIVFQAGTHSGTMSIAYADFDRLVHPTVGELATAR